MAAPREIIICHKTINRNNETVGNMDYDNDVNAAVFLSCRRTCSYEEADIVVGMMTVDLLVGMMTVICSQMLNAK